MELTLEIDTSSIGKLPGRWEQAKARGLNESAQTLVRFLMQNSPVDHGLLKQWFIESIDEEQATIKSPAEYAIYQDQGTQPYMIQSRKPNGYLFWEGADHPVKTVHHPGIRAKHFVQQSLDELSPLAPGYFLRALEESG
jgi:hypothetical protein